MNLDEARALYPEIKNLLPLASPEWSESYNLRESIAEISIPNRYSGEVEPIAHILADCPYDDRRLMLKAPLYMNAMWILLQEALKRIPREQPAPQRSKNGIQTYAQACGRMCGDPDFLRFLAVCEGVDISDRERVARRVRSMLSVSSRAELDTDDDARARWLGLYERFKAWMEQQVKP